MIRLKTEKDIEGLRKSGRILSHIISELKGIIAVGVRLDELEKKAADLLDDAGAEGAFLGYRPEQGSEAYPANTCISLNEQIVHGLPDNRLISDGDAVSVDIGVRYKGYITDAAFTVAVGNASEEKLRLISVTRQALLLAIAECIPGKHLGDIGNAVERHAGDNGFKVIRNLVGHGVGFAVHEEPEVYNFGEPGKGIELVSGMVLALEPMLSVSALRAVREKDGSFVTEDGSPSAHFETTVAITESGPEVLVEAPAIFSV